MKMKKLSAALVAGAGLLTLAGCSDQDSTPLAPGGANFELGSADIVELTSPDFIPGRVLVRFRPGADRLAVAVANRARHQRDMRLERAAVLEVPVGEEREIALSLARDPNVEFAEPDYLYTIIPCETGDCKATDDFFMGYKWDLHNDGTIRDRAGAWLATTPLVDADIDWMEAQEHLGASFAGSAVIGILDTGIRHTHQDLAGKVIAARNFAIGYPATLIADRDGHGTHVAGVAAAHGSNGTGVAGVAYGANIKLINAKVCDRYKLRDGSVRTFCPTSSTADAIVWATDQGADVLNLSLGGSPAATSGSAVQQAALQYARSQNVLPFCATGNNNFNGIAFPARFPECVAVGATDWNDARASYSNFGPQVELSAPGGAANSAGTPFSRILAPTFNTDDSYGWKAGTSMATPQAAGLAGVLFATGMTSASEVLQRIKETVDDLGPAGWDPEFGEGRINMYRAVTQKDPAIEMAISTRGTASLSSQGAMQVVLLDREAQTFSLGMIDLGSITLGRTAIALRQNGSPFASWSDVDLDGRADLVLHFMVPALRSNGDLAASTTQLTLRGRISDGRRMRGTTGIRVIP